MEMPMEMEWCSYAHAYYAHLGSPVFVVVVVVLVTRDASILGIVVNATPVVRLGFIGRRLDCFEGERRQQHRKQ